jgi:hypothetical protein
MSITELIELLRLVNAKGHPNVSELWREIKDLRATRLNVKNLGYELAALLHERNLRGAPPSDPGFAGLTSKPTTQADIESQWFAYWCGQLKIAPIYHRKVWEFAFLLQVMREQGFLTPGNRGIGFGCGTEPIASLLASREIHATVTDLAPEQVAGAGWAETSQHAGALDAAFHANLVDRARFEKFVDHRFVDMNAIPQVEKPYDFCWSICALEHLGSIANGLRFIENSLGTLRPGGLAVHTTEFNFLEEDRTIDNWPTVLFLRKHFSELARRLESQGHTVLPLDFNVGDRPLDRYIDLPPFMTDEPNLPSSQWGAVNQRAHLKLSIDGFPSTCFGFVVRRKA